MRHYSDAESQDELFSALANPTRRELLELLRRHGELPVRDMAARFDMTRPSISEHLRVLRDAGLVAEQRSGRERLYRLEPLTLMGLRDWLRPYEEFWRTRVANLRQLLEDEENG